MRDRDLYAKLLGIESPWHVRDVEARLEQGEVEIFIALDEGAELACPVCGTTASRYDSRSRSWRHLDTMQYRTLLTAEVPRVKCPTHGVKQIQVPWALPGGRFTAMFEALVIDWLAEASHSAVAKMLRMSWDEVDGVMQRAVARGLSRRQSEPLRNIGVDETSFQKRHEYVTVVYDCDRKRVLEVLDGRTQAALEEFYWATPKEHLDTLRSVSMDMSAAYIEATRLHVSGADKKICLDRFHVAKNFGDAVNKVRVDEHAELQAEGVDLLKGTRFLWLQSPDKMNPSRRLRFDVLRQTSLKVARAWAMKETAHGLWHFKTRAGARRAWLHLIRWLTHSRLPPMVKLGRTLRTHLWGIVNAIVYRVSNAHLESVNAKIQALKKRACGYRNRDRFRNAILFHTGGLDLYPALATHTDS